MTIQYIFTDFRGPYREGMTAVRLKAFVEEQGVSHAEEMDGLDDEARHLAAVRDGLVVGTLRWFTGDDYVKVGRVAVHTPLRAQGIGTAMMRKVIECARDNGARKIICDSQTQVANFYAKLGFIEEGDIFLDAGIDHIRMSLAL
jgi:predicted GNAT family N-acyltransferase